MDAKTLPKILLLTISTAIVFTGCSQKAQIEEYLDRANESFARGDLRTAEIEYKNVLQLVSSISEAVGNIGLIYYRQGRFAEAYPFLNQARTLAPDNLSYRSKFSALMQQLSLIHI